MKVIEVIADAGHADTLHEIARRLEVEVLWCGTDSEGGRSAMHLLVPPGKRQDLLDALSHILGSSPDARVLVLPVEAVLPLQVAAAETAGGGKSEGVAREELYSGIEKGARINGTFILLVVLSTIVAAIGLIEDNVAVVIGAMVIAPLLGPNLALALATALGDTRLMGVALKSNLLGLGLAIGLTFVAGLVWPGSLESGELLARTVVGFDSIALALASGAAAVLSLVTGLPSVLVGVMVAVALLPPASALGLMLGSGQYDLAVGAALLLAVNIVCVNLSAKLVFLFKGVRPRGWLEKRKARQSMLVYILLWIVTLVLLVLLILPRQTLVISG